MIRPFPYPYRAMLAICSDLDRTPDLGAYLEASRYLNTREATSMGEGVGLEVGNTIYFDMPPDQFSYWNTGEGGREAVRALVRSGHVDCLHSYGDLAGTRGHAERALGELERHGCRLAVWIDHAVAPTNFGGDIMRGSGDVEGSPAYHADISCAHGIRFVWRGRVTSVSGQDAARSLAGIADWRHPAASVRTLAKEWAKGWAGRIDGSRFAIHPPNRVLRRTTLRSGHPVLEFLRSNPSYGGVSHDETADGIASVLGSRFLDLLVERGGTSVLYTHLGKAIDRRTPFSSTTRSAFARLARFSESRRILVTTTRRLLEYCLAREEVVVSATVEGETVRVDLSDRRREGGRDAASLRLDGLTVYVDDPARVRLYAYGREIREFDRNGPDETGRRSVSVPWRPLRYPRSFGPTGRGGSS